MHRYIATSVEGFGTAIGRWVCYPRVLLLRDGNILAEKDPAKTDRKIIEQYRIDVSKSTRVKQKKAGEANSNIFALGTSSSSLLRFGVHRFFEDEATQIKDLREAPILSTVTKFPAVGARAQRIRRLGSMRSATTN